MGSPTPSRRYQAGRVERGHGGPSRAGLPRHRGDLRAGHHERGERGDAAVPEPAQRPLARHPRDQREQDQDRGHDRRLLVDQDGESEHQPDPPGPADPGAAPQPDRGLQGQREEHRPGRDVQVKPVLERHHRGQAEQGPRGDRAHLRRDPQSRRPVHHVAQHPGQQHDQQVVADRRTGQQRDGEHRQAQQGHQGVVTQLHPHRGGQRGGEPRVSQVGHLVRHPPQAPDVTRRVGQVRQAAAQVGGQRPGGRHSRGDIPGQHRQLIDGSAARDGPAGDLVRWRRSGMARARCDGPESRPGGPAGRAAHCRGWPGVHQIARPCLVCIVIWARTRAGRPPVLTDSAAAQCSKTQCR